jgi:hypothetical protein
MPYGYNPAQSVKDFSGLERGLTGAISKAGIAIGDYVKVVKDNKAMDELKVGLIDRHAQQRHDILGEPIKEAKRNASRLFLPRLKGESNESLFRRWEIAGKNAKQQLTTQRQKQVTKQTTEAKGGGFFPAGQGTQISGPPVQGPLQPGQEKIPSQAEQMGLRTPPLQPQAFTGPRETQEGIASSLAARSTMQGQPQPTMSELKEQPAFATAPTQTQQTAQKREERIKDYQSAKLELQEKRLDNKVDDEYIKLQRLWLDYARFDFQKRKEQNRGLDFIIRDTVESKKFARKRVGELKEEIQKVKSNPMHTGAAKEILLSDLEDQLRDSETAAKLSDQNLNFYAKIMRQEPGTTGQKTSAGFELSPPGGGTTQAQQPKQKRPLASFGSSK